MSTKEQLLALFEKNRGQSISGESIAEQFGVSRNSIWKAIKELKAAGYNISAVRNKGYCFNEDNDILSVQGILPFLSSEEYAEKITIFDTLNSTNQRAKELALDGADHGTVVVAEKQTEGKGRFGRQFYSSPHGGIYLSIIMHPEKTIYETLTPITAFAAVLVCEAIEAVSGKSPQIKWVNDIYLDGKKICGILTEAITDIESGSIQWIVIGIGINFNIKNDDFPKDLRLRAGSIFSDESTSPSRNHLIAEIINRFEEYSVSYTTAEILEEYKKRLMMLGDAVLVTSENESYQALAAEMNVTLSNASG